MRYKDPFGLEVELQFKRDSDKQNANHVLVLPIMNQQLILTQHKIRGIEFPGGKVELGEQSIQAAKRELYEETGAISSCLYYIAKYTVYDNIPFDKDVYVAICEEIIAKKDYQETNGPLLVDDLGDINEEEKSFLLKDQAILKCVERMYNLGFHK